MAKEKESSKFVNPFEKGVTYEQVIKAMGSSSVKDYLKGKEFTDAQVTWIENELENYKSNNK